MRNEHYEALRLVEEWLIENGAPGPIHFWNPPMEAGPTLDRFAKEQAVEASTYWAPTHVALQAYIRSTASAQGTLVILASRQKAETLGAVASLLQPGHQLLILAASNDWGSHSYQKHLKSVWPQLESLSGRKCRLSIIRQPETTHPNLATWRVDAQPFLLSQEPEWWTQAGVFGWKKHDGGSLLLEETLATADLHGTVVDAGAGTGYLSHAVLTHHQPTAVSLVEADLRAVECARKNLAAISTVPCEFIWHDFLTWHPSQPVQHVIMNPPFHQGRRADREYGQRFLLHAHEILAPGGSLWVVANAFLPYEALLRNSYASLEPVVRTESYKVLLAQKS
ncbi:MAG: class I SAM-dependent methyltransferase [Verrucomicrobiales bacterium]